MLAAVRARRARIGVTFSVVTLLVAWLLTACASTQAAPAPVQAVDPLTRATPEQLVQLGLGFARQGDHIRAEQYLTASIERGVDSRVVIEPLMRVCIVSSRYGTALRHGRDHLARYPEDWSMRLLVANLLGAVSRADEQQLELEQLIEERPTEPVPHFALAQRLLADGDDRGGRAELLTYLRLAPQGPHARAAKIHLRQIKRPVPKNRRR